MRLLDRGLITQMKPTPAYGPRLTMVNLVVVPYLPITPTEIISTTKVSTTSTPHIWIPDDPIYVSPIR